MIDEGVDVAIRSGALPDSSLVSRPLNAFRLMLWASPAYLARRGSPATVGDLNGHATIRFRHPGSGKLLEWPMLQAAPEAETSLRTVLACNNMEAVLSATERDVGIACMPDFLVHEARAAGRLVSVLADRLGVDGRFNALWPSSRHLSPKVRVFVDHLSASLPGAAGP